MNCKYSKSCPEYESESLLCCFAYNFCKNKKYFDQIKEDKEKREIKDLGEHLKKLCGWGKNKW